LTMEPRKRSVSVRREPGVLFVMRRVLLVVFTVCFSVWAFAQQAPERRVRQQVPEGARQHLELRIEKLERLTREQVNAINILAGQLKALQKEVDELKRGNRVNP